MDDMGTWVSIPRTEPPLLNNFVKIGHQGPDGSIIKENVTFTALFHGDCFEEMAKLPDGIVDMVLCDPPYQATRIKWDVALPLDKLWK